MSSSFFDRIFEHDISLKKNINAEVLITDSTGRLSGISQVEAFGFVNAKSFGAIGNLVYRVNPNSKTVSYISGTDGTVAIQNALNAAADLTNIFNTKYNTKIRCYIPGGNYYITSQLIIPANVILQCDGVLFNFISNNYTPIIIGSQNSECERLAVFANNKNGVQWGINPTLDLGSTICDLKVYAVGSTYSALQTYQQSGLRLLGKNIAVRNVFLEDGCIGLDISGQCISASEVILTKSQTGACLNSCEHVSLKNILWDTVVDMACQIDGSANCQIEGTSFVNSNNGGTPMSRGILVGAKSNLISTNLDIKYIAQSTGGILLDISRTKDCKFDLSGTNSRTSAQSNTTNSSHWIPNISGSVSPHDIGTVYNYNNNNPTEANLGIINYGSNISGFLNVNLNLDESIQFLYSGTQVGFLQVISRNYVLTYVNNVDQSVRKTFVFQTSSPGIYDLNINSSYIAYDFKLCGCGGGGGSGRVSAPGTAAFGGGGGGAGAISELSGLVSELLGNSSNVLYRFSLAAKGSGGLAVTTPNTDGNDGTSGGSAIIRRVSDLSVVVTAPGGTRGLGGTALSGTAGAVVNSGLHIGTAGTPSLITTIPATPNSANLAPAGGAGGGGIDATNNPRAGGSRGIGGATVGTNVIATNGGVASTTSNAGNGADAQVKLFYGNSGGHGGAGGGASTLGNGGRGGKGDRGGGGGGGGAARNGYSSGAGNDGGDGWIIIELRG